MLNEEKIKEILLVNDLFRLSFMKGVIVVDKNNEKRILEVLDINNFLKVLEREYN